jgi:hypothetical protein
LTQALRRSSDAIYNQNLSLTLACANNLDIAVLIGSVADINSPEHPHVGTIIPFTTGIGDNNEETRPSHVDTSNTTNYVTVSNDQWVKNALIKQFPPPEWLKLLERSPYEPLQKSYQNGNELKDVVKGVPKIRIAITFLGGGDKPTVTGAEMKKLEGEPPDQKTPEWRVFTAATLLKTFIVRADLSIHQSDDSTNILSRGFGDDKKRLSIGQPFAPVQRTLTGTSGNSVSDKKEETAVIRRNIQDNTLTIDSNNVQLLHDNPPEGHDYHIASTLIEIDLFSMRDLMINYHQVVQSGQPSLKHKEIIPILDIMINDVCRLCTRSPRLFRVSTRALIARSTSTRYGVDYGSLFVTLTTSEGIRQLIEKSSAFYHSLDENKADQAKIRPKFLQMLILLLSLLNNTDLGKITKLLEDTFELPGDRESLELIIMKVLPLQSIGPAAFLEGIFQAYKPREPKESYQLRLHQGIWEELQIELVKSGYIVPVLMTQGSTTAQLSKGMVALDLKKMLKGKRTGASAASSAFTGHNGQKADSGSSGPSFLPSWPTEGGFDSSTVFKYLQHDGKLRTKSSGKQASVRGINQIPHLEITTVDRDNTVLALFSNNEKYRVLADEPQYISAMTTGHYLLTPPNKDDNRKSKTLEIMDQVLNKPFIEATEILHQIVEQYKQAFGARAERRSVSNVFSRNKAPSEFSAPDIPPIAKRFWAEIVSLDDSGKREICAEAFKVANKVVYKDDIVREMTNSLAKLNAAKTRIGEEIDYYTKKLTRDFPRQQQEEVEKLARKVQRLRDLLVEAEAKQNEANKLSQDHSEDPIKEIIYPSLDYDPAERPEWQHYMMEFDTDESGQKSLIVLSKQFAVFATKRGKGDNVELTLDGCGLTLTVQPLTSSILGQRSRDIKERDKVLWLGYYLAVIEPTADDECSRVVAYFRVVSQKPGEGQFSDTVRLEDFEDELCQLI